MERLKIHPFSKLKTFTEAYVMKMDGEEFLVEVRVTKLTS